MKRFLDVVAAGLGLAVLSPVVVLLAVIIMLDDGPPVFFRQERAGLGGRPFRIWKFRTMSAVDADRGPSVTSGCDGRITRSGRFLRKFKLDEIPQLINVLAGDMSIVGPRPEVPGLLARYPADLRALMISVRPGITDYASVEFADENALIDSTGDVERQYFEKILPIKRILIERYIAERSLSVDFKIVLLTLKKVFL